MLSVPTLHMNDGRTIPQLGYGVFQIPPEETQAAVTRALDAGYRLIDTAQGYRNEEGVGAAIAASDIPRDELFITSKLTNSDHGYDAAMRSFDASLQRLGIDEIDLFLIHWPLPMFDQYVETWRAFEKIRADGRARSIGVSNFTVEHVQRLIDETGVVPAANQIELHPWLAQSELRAFHAQHGIITESWGPIGQGKGVLEEPTITEIAAQTGKSPAQVVLMWQLQLGNLAIPKSVTPARIAENIDIFDATLTDEQMAAISALDHGKRLGPDPETFANR